MIKNKKCTCQGFPVYMALIIVTLHMLDSLLSFLEPFQDAITKNEEKNPV